jgi:hypothetical protein
MSLKVRKKKNSSGSTSIHIVDRTNREYKIIESLGSSKDEYEIESLYNQALTRIDELENNLLHFSKNNDKKEQLLDLLSDITTDSFIPIGDELIFGKLFDDIGCSKIFENTNSNLRKIDEKIFLFRSLVISRLLYPGSKLELIHYFEYFKKRDINIYKIYRFLDTLYQDEIKSNIESCVFEHTKKIMNNEIVLTFYDVTTLYFESESEDDLRRIGFSKEGKLARPQIQLGLFTTLEGYPLSYEVYEGNKYEGHTLIDILKKFQTKFQLDHKPIVVADRGMLTNANIAYLENNNYKYILAYKIKNISNELKEQIANLTFIDDNAIHTIDIKDKTIEYKDDNDQKQKLAINQKLIISYSSKRAKKDKKTREKALEKIEAKLNKKNINKSDLKLSYYAKYLDIDDSCNIKYALNKNKVLQDEKLDGLKGFATNDFKLKANDVIAHYNNQYEVERAFRISKTDLKIRPIFHRLETRIKAHVLISFVSYAIYKEFERKLKLNDVKFNYSQKFLRKIIEHLIALKIDDEIIPINPSDIQKQILDAMKN